jgi:hypothetical protein
VLPLGAQAKNLDPVCGCNGITYFNPSIAESAAMSVSAAGSCNDQVAIACSKSSLCPAGSFCNMQVPGTVDCFLGGTNPTGTCWATPTACDPAGPKGRGCSPPSFCADVCSLIQSQNTWHADLLCF